jgi:transcriptional regulator of acetoin/glycerol metabolism
MPPKLTRESLQAAIDRYGGHRESMAKHFGISRMTLWRRMKQFGLD